MKNNAMAIGVRTRFIYGVLAIMTIMLGIGENTMAQTKSTAVVKNIVLVHGGLVDGSGWKDVYKILKKDGYTVSIVQEPTISLPDDVAVTKRVIDGQNGPVILVGHSYRGVVITEAGNDPKVAGITANSLFEGCSLAAESSLRRYRFGSCQCKQQTTRDECGEAWLDTEPSEMVRLRLGTVA